MTSNTAAIIVGCSVRAKSSGEVPPRTSIERDGFTATLARVKELGLDLSNVPMGALRMFYDAGLAFADADRTPSSQRSLWRNSIIYPIRLLIVALCGICSLIKPQWPLVAVAVLLVCIDLLIGGR